MTQFHKPQKRPRTEIEANLDEALRVIDVRLYEASRESLEVNRPKRVVPHYPFVPSHHHPDPV
jgi:hypothetical protein